GLATLAGQNWYNTFGSRRAWPRRSRSSSRRGFVLDGVNAGPPCLGCGAAEQNASRRESNRQSISDIRHNYE
ncbi:hypothetical protein, partial [Salinicola salarius]|uniref:hypothetical protein n=1 Tax=Salinicola salarius TaxID=430457 RepID=UPI001ABFE8B3